jgi:Zn-dependent protease with chaperone function
MTGYRYEGEHLILFVTGFLIFLVLAFSAIPTLCFAPVLMAGFLGLAYLTNRSNQRAIIRSGVLVSPHQLPKLARLAEECMRSLQPGPVQVFVVPSQTLNAFTFGFSNPKTVVLFSPMLEVMDDEELKFVIGHELGHVALGHAWLNTLLGGMAGVPTSLSAAVILTLAFRWWNRACEYSADRAGLLACGSLNKSISALAQLAVGDLNTQAELQQALRMLENQDGSWSGALGEALSTHPLIIKRIQELRKWAASHNSTLSQ